MKKLFLIFSLISLVVLANSCKKDKIDPAELLKQQMTGKWIFDKYQTEDFDANGNSQGAPTVYEQDDLKAYIEFKSDGNQVMTKDGQNLNFDTWKIVDEQSFTLGTYIQKVVKIDAISFVYMEEIIDPDGTKSVYTYTLKK